MGSTAPSWKNQADAKRQAVLDMMPAAWCLPTPLPTPAEQADVTGTFKEQFYVRGVETTMGCVGCIGTLRDRKGTGKEKENESELVREIRALGGVPFCKTSVPHTVMSAKTWNWRQRAHPGGVLQHLRPALNEKLGHQTIDMHYHIGLSGEPLFLYRRDYLDYWNSTAALTNSDRPVDAVLSPTKRVAGYTPWANTLDYTAAVFPVAKVDPAVDKKEQNYVPLNDNDKTIRDEFDPVAEANAPVGLQLVDRRFQEEKIPALEKQPYTQVCHQKQ
ncbi:MAG: hypothetical protein STHCBS139747_004632 [Sporothrix thermara]